MCKVIYREIGACDDRLVARGKLALESVLVDLCFKLAREHINGKGSPGLAVLVEAVERADRVESRHLYIKPVKRGGAVHKELSVLPDRHTDSRPGFIGDRGRV